MKDKLPSLTAIRAFEVSARRMNFARAAAELGVQPPAVSRQIAELEQCLGQQLFIRSKPRLTLTHAGESLNLSQSAVSRQIRGLEESLGATLFQ